MPGLASQLNDDIAELVESVRASLVRIGAGGRGNGAGTIWHADGLILSNAHVAQGKRIQVTLSDGRSLPASILARDEHLDIAALAVNATGLPTIPLGDSKRLRAGQLVLALGHPWGVSGAATAGVVIGVGSQWPELPSSKRDWIVASLNLRPCNSGGALVDAHGRLVGINTLVTGPQVGMAVPVHAAKRFLREALDSKTDTA